MNAFNVIYISLFTEIILQQLVEFQTKVPLRNCVHSKCLGVTLQKWQNLPIIAPGAAKHGIFDQSVMA